MMDGSNVRMRRSTRGLVERACAGDRMGPAMATPMNTARTRQGRRVDAASTLRREARRREFLDAAIEVIRSAGPGASMDQVAARIGVTKPVVYRYFGDRNGMYRAVAERYCGELRNKFRGAMSTTSDLRSVVVVAVDAYLELVERDPQVHRFLIQPQPPGRGGDGPAITPFIRSVAAEIVDALRLRLQAAALDPEVAEPWGHALVGAPHHAPHPPGRAPGHAALGRPRQRRRRHPAGRDRPGRGAGARGRRQAPAQGLKLRGPPSRTPRTPSREDPVSPALGTADPPN